MMNQDNAKTRIRSRGVPFRPTQQGEPDCSVNVLPPGTFLGEFEILEIIGEGGFGVVYLAYDHSLERRVALKEYMPSGLAARTTKLAVTVRSQHNLDTFSIGLKSFINEAKMLAKFDSPALVKVHSFWEGNGTAYMVMPYYEGSTLKQALKAHRIAPTEPWVRLVLSDLFDAIEIIHRAQCLHRDIAPDNILILKDGRPLLLDFGAARQVIGDMSQSLTAILKPGFAPIEQYADIAGLRQGPWTDIYALGAVMYYLIAGKSPPPAVARMVKDEMVPISAIGKGKYSPNFLQAIDKALSVRPEARFQTIGEMRRALDILDAVPRTLPETITNWSTTVARTTPVDKGTPFAPSRPVHGNGKNSDVSNVQPTIMQGKDQAEQQQEKPPNFSPKSPYPDKSGKSGDNGEYGVLPSRFLANSQDAPAAAAPVRERIEPFISPNPHERAAAQAAKQPPASSLSRKKPWLYITALFFLTLGASVYFGSARLESAFRQRDILTPAAAPDRMEDGTTSSGSSAETTAAGSEMDSADKPAPQVAEPVRRPEPVERKATPPLPPLAKVTPPPAPTVSATPATKENPARALHKPTESNLWQKAVADNTSASYRHYLEEYPKGRYAEVARIRLQNLLAKSSRQEASPAHSQRKKEALIVNVPPSENNAYMSSDERAWIRASTINTPLAYQEYLSQFPRGGFAAVAKDRLGGYKQVDPVDTSPAPAPPVLERQTERVSPLVPEVPREGKPATTQPDAANDPPVQRAAPRTLSPSSSLPSSTPARNTLRVGDQTVSGDYTVDQNNGRISGKVRIIWNNGNQFEGTMVNGIKTGKGKFTWSNGQTYSGDWARDEPNGRGKFFYPDGSRYEGEVRDGLRHGQGTFWFKGGSTYRGEWVAGKSHGHGRYTWASGSYWEGEFRNDNRTENGKLVRQEQALPASAAESAGHDAISASGLPDKQGNASGN